MRLIDEEALFNETLKLAWNKENENTATFLELVHKQPTASVKRGHWVPEYEEYGKLIRFHCSECDKDGCKIGNLTATSYCPDCGAKMDVFNRCQKKNT